VKRVAPTRPPAPVPASKKKRTGLQGTVDASAPLGVVDPASGINGSIITSPVDGAPLDCMLVLIDPAQNMDKYFVLQLIENEDKVENRGDSGNGKPDKSFVVYTRWGRTGTAGAALQQEFNDEYEAMECFEVCLNLSCLRRLRSLPWFVAYVANLHVLHFCFVRYAGRISLKTKRAMDSMIARNLLFPASTQTCW
jgi:predicted DNA-binding WGR domain protein